jgi:hypothetical protein
MTEQNTLNINIKSEENTMAIDITAKINFKMSNLLHLCTIKSPTLSAFISSKCNSYHALEKCEGVKFSNKNNETQLIEKNENTIPEQKTYKNALLIGCNYKKTEYELNGCINDANNIKKLLTDIYGFDNTELMTDDTPILPTKNNILTGITRLLNNANCGDILFLSFSGHGLNIKDRNMDETDLLDEVIVSLDLNYIIDDELNSLIRSHLKKDVTLFALFDSCHSGTMLDLRYHYLDSTTSNKDTEELKYLEMEGNIVMISGCMDKQTSMDVYIRSAKMYQGIMTAVFLDTIKKNPDVSWNDLLTTMRSELKLAKYSQIPQLSSGKKLDVTLKFLHA